MEVTAIRRVVVKGSRKLLATMVVTTNPAIIISQTMVAAGARRAGSTRVASKASRDVPAAPTPMPTNVNASVASARPAAKFVSISATAAAAPAPPSARMTMPNMIHGVRRPPVSEP